MTEPTSTLCILGATSAVAIAYARQAILAAPDSVRLILMGRNTERLEQLADDFRARGAHSASVISGEIGVPSQTGRLFGLAVSQGDIDEVFLAYGTLGDQETLQSDPDALSSLIDTNYASAALWLERFANRFAMAGRGQLTVLGSVAGDRGRQSNYQYGATKAALERICEGMAHRFVLKGHKNVRITLIKPGFIDTPMTAHLDKGGPLWAQPEEIAAIAHKAVTKKRMRVYAPWFWRYILLIVRAVPQFIITRTKL